MSPPHGPVFGDQFFANAWRALQWWGFVRWRIFWLYCLGGAVAFP